MKTKIKPIVSWGIWAVGLSLVMGIITRNFILAGFRADTTGMSFVIAALFMGGLVASFRAAMLLQSEWGVLNRVVKTKQVPLANGKSGLSDIFNKLADYKRTGHTVDIHTAIDTYHAGHNSRVRSVSIMAALLISMGLLGTIIGLIMAISGLGGMVENIGLSRATMMDALKTTVSGMGTAFYTTFFGALGGLILRAVAVSQLNSLSELCAAATEYADVNLVAKLDNKEEEINQQVSKVVASFENMQREIDSLTHRIAGSIETTMARFGEALETAGQCALEATEKCFGGMTEQMAELGGEARLSFGALNGAIETSGAEMAQSFTTLNASIEKSGAGVVESFGGLNASVNEAGNTVAGSLADFRLAIDNTSSELDGAVAELKTAINQATGVMATMSAAKLDTEASEIAGQLSLAADSIQNFLKLKTGSVSNQKVA
ncbi:MAG: MotA/TolQ/ExbB proton channel family protein [Kiritimatiellales bacterium]|nr:MotA/TolQ/ExbB proton channel family protein [Kiritimatiellales bacterium]MCF7863678.1 MotA/TolQ/ExbB proton channel family protein [Kiritimatiellales bacterium]